MRTHLHSSVLIAFAGVLAMPFFVLAQTVQYANGISTCAQNGSAGLSSAIGSYSPRGGPYVPVVDYTVEVNTASLVYKECVLREIVTQQRKAATATIAKDIIQKFNSRGFPRDLKKDILARQDTAITRAIKDQGLLGTLNSKLAQIVKSAIALSYQVDTRYSSNTVNCPYQGTNINDMLYGREYSISGFWAEVDPRCQPIYAYYLADNLVQQHVQSEVDEMMFRLNTSNGIYGVEAIDPATGNHITLTPGIFVQENMSLALQTGFIQLQNADDLGEIVSSMFAALSDQATTYAPGGQDGLSGLGGGLNSLTQGQPSYLDQMWQNELNGLGGTINNGILATLQNILAIEKLYNQAVTAIGSLVQQAIAQLQSAETKCFSDTTHSQQAISQNLSPIVTDVAPKIASSTIAIAGLNSLIARMSSTTPPSSSEISQILNSLPLNSQQQADAEQARLRQLQVNVPQFVQDTIAAWQSDPSAAVGCGSI